MPSKPPPLGLGAVVLVSFPFTNQAGAKKRPAVVVSSAAYAQARPDVVLMAITSQLRPTQTFGEIWITDWKAAGLLKPSAIKPVIATFEQKLIVRRLGSLAALDQKALSVGLTRLFDLDA